MRKEKYIVERYSTKPGHEEEIVSFQVSMHYKEGDIRKNLKKSFPVSKYRTCSLALKAAVAWRDDHASEIVNKKFVRLPLSYTVDEIYQMVPDYFPLSKATIKKDDKVYKKYIQPEYGGTPIVNIKKQDILSTLVKCAANCVDQHVRNVKTVWHKIYSIAVEIDVLQKDLTQFIKAPRGCHITERRMSEQNITEEDFEKFCEYLEEYGHYMPYEKEKIYNRTMILYMIRLQRITGIRLQEVRAIRKDAVSFQKYRPPGEKDPSKTQIKAMLSITVSIGSTHNKDLQIIHTKTLKSIRTIPVFGTGVEILKSALNYTKHDLIFAKYDGKPFSTDEVSNYLYRVSNACGIKVYSTLMRKSFSSDLIAGHVDPETVKELMGHESINMSLYYASANRENLNQTMMKREELYKKKEME